MTSGTDGLTAERLRQVLHYNPETGAFTWRQRISIRIVVGKLAGTVGKRGYLGIGVDGRHYPAHRLAWLYMTDQWPPCQIDHADRCKTNNRWNNLRLDLKRENAHNESLRRNNTSGVPGVSWDKRRGCWIAKICIRRKQLYLGSFGQDMGAACAAHQDAKSRLHPFHHAPESKRA